MQRWAVLMTVVVSAVAAAQERVGVSLNVYAEGGRRDGERWINNSREPENDEWVGPALSADAYVLYGGKELKIPPSIRIGPGVRVYGEYASLGQRYAYGILNDLYMIGEFSLPAFERFELALGARAGLSLLIPTGDFASEIRRLQAQGIGAWSIPRVGWIAGVNAGMRRKMIDRFWLRLDFLGNWQTLYLFAIDETQGGYRFRKYWSVSSLRLGATLSAEVTF